MSIIRLVERFYGELWNEVNLLAAAEILHPEVSFRGSVGLGASGRAEVCDYISMVTTALSEYRCDVQGVIANGNRAAVKVRFAGIHVGEFLGYQPTGRGVEWMGAGFFTSSEDLLQDIWVLGDVVTLKTQLEGRS
ncbi:MAG: ester cyclase [Actinomycetota bacterium]